MFNSCEKAHVNIHKHSITNLSNVMAGRVTILMDNNNITLVYTIENIISFAKTLMIWTSFWTNTAEPISANVLAPGCVSCDDFQQTLKSNTIGSSHEQTD